MNRNKQKSILLMSGLLLSLGSTAQIDKGTVYLGGQSNFSRSLNKVTNLPFTNEVTQTYFSLNPQAGYYLSKSFALGLGLSYNANQNHNVQSGTTNNNSVIADLSQSTLLMSILGRYNKALGRGFYFFVDGAISTNIGGRSTSFSEVIENGKKTTTSLSQNDMAGQILRINIRPGVAYFVTPRLGIEATMGRVYANFQKENTFVGPQYASANVSEVGYNFNPSSFLLGVNYYFAKKAKPKNVAEIDE